MAGPLKAGDRLAKSGARGRSRNTTGGNGPRGNAPRGDGARGNGARGDGARGGGARGNGGGRPPRTPQGGGRGGFFRFAGGRLTRLVYGGLLLLVLAGIVGGGGLFLYFGSNLPSIARLRHYHPPLETRIYASDFKLVGTLGSQRRIYVPYESIPPIVRQAFISAEDRNFWTEPGVDPLAILRAGVVDLTRLGSGQRPLGASTITMQVVKNMLLNNRIDFTRKIKEAILAVRVDHALSKKQILTLYLNEIFLGQNAWGVGAAAEAYFGKPLSQLSIADAATLGALPKAPTTYNPFLHPNKALARRNWVLGRMHDDGYITKAQEKAAQAAPLLPKAEAAPKPVPGAGYFVSAVRDRLIQLFGRKTAMEGGLIVRTSLEPRLETAMTTALRDRLQAYDHEFGAYRGPVGHAAPKSGQSLDADWRKLLAAQKTPAGLRRAWTTGIVISETDRAAKIGYIDAGAPHVGTLTLAAMQWGRPLVHGHPGPLMRRVSTLLKPGDIVMINPHQHPKGGSVALEQVPKVEGAMLSMDPRTGRVLAMVGGWSYRLSPYNRATQAHRQPGSGVKPFDYLTAMEAGVQPDATILDAPFTERMSNGTLYRPGDYENGFRGPVPVFYGLQESLNLATLHLVKRVGLANVAANFEKFGIVHHMPLIYPAAIGALDTTVWRIARGYAALAEYGRQVKPSLIDSVTAPDGRILYQAPEQSCANCMDGAPGDPPALTRPGVQLADPDSVFQVLTMMQDVVKHGTGTIAGHGFKRPIAGKTGTTNDFNDAWFTGFVPQMVTSCWIGFDTPRNLGHNQTGGRVCGPAWHQYMAAALKGLRPIGFPVPPGITMQKVSFHGETVEQAFKQGQSPGAQSNGALVADTPIGEAEGVTAAGGAPQYDAPQYDSSLAEGQGGGASGASGPPAGNNPNGPNGNGSKGNTAGSNAAIDKSLGGLY